MAKLFVGNLSFTTTGGDLQAWFELNGYAVESVQVMMDRKTGRSRGIAFVVLKQNDQLKDAIDKLNGKTLSGRTISVEDICGRPRDRFPQDFNKRPTRTRVFARS